MLVQAVGVCLLLVAAVLVTYYSLPWDGTHIDDLVLRLVVGIVAIVVIAVVAVRIVLRAEYPLVRAAEVLVVVVAVAIALFASIYAYLSHLDPASFTEPLSRTDALYFAVTTATTVGYGDISALTETARVLVMVQMVVNVAVIGIAARTLIYAARKRVEEA